MKRLSTTQVVSVLAGVVGKHLELLFLLYEEGADLVQLQFDDRLKILSSRVCSARKS